MKHANAMKAGQEIHVKNEHAKKIVLIEDYVKMMSVCALMDGEVNFVS